MLIETILTDILEMVKVHQSLRSQLVAPIYSSVNLYQDYDRNVTILLKLFLISPESFT